MSLATFRQCISTVPSEVDISFAGYAEPWLNPECTAMVEHANSQGHGIRIFTTLVGMDEDDVERLRRLPIKLFVVHVFDDGMHMNPKYVSERHCRLTRRVIDAGIAPLRFLVFGAVHPQLENILPHDMIVRTRPLISRAGNVDASIVPPRERVEGPLVCIEGREYRNVLLPNGDVTLCCMDYERRHVLGNLLTDDYRALHTGEVFEAILRRLDGAEGFLLCRTCEYAEQRVAHANLQ